MNRYKCVIFDLDGTIIDSSSGIRKSIEETIKVLNFSQMDEAELESCIGPPIQDSFRRIYHLNEKDANDAAAVFREYYKEKYLYDAEVYQGMKELLKQLRSHGILTMIATYKREDYTMKLLEKFDLLKLFDYVKGSDFEGKLKKADIINLCMEQSQCSKNEIVMVGDTSHDSGAACEVGLDFIAVTYGFGFQANSNVKGAICTVDSVQELSDYFGKNI